MGVFKDIKRKISFRRHKSDLEDAIDALLTEGMIDVLESYKEGDIRLYAGLRPRYVKGREREFSETYILLEALYHDEPILSKKLYFMDVYRRIRGLFEKNPSKYKEFLDVLRKEKPYDLSHEALAEKAMEAAVEKKPEIVHRITFAERRALEKVVPKKYNPRIQIQQLAHELYNEAKETLGKKGKAKNSVLLSVTILLIGIFAVMGFMVGNTTTGYSVLFNPANLLFYIISIALVLLIVSYLIWVQRFF